MPDPLIATKFTIPAPRPKRVGRTHLVRKLSAAAEQAVTVVCAPAGFGKSTLVAEWALAQTRPVAWLSLDPADNAPAHLLRYVIGALQAVDPALVPGLSAGLQAPEAETVEAVAAALINALSGRPTPLTLVLDDWHVIDDSATRALLARLVTHLPPTLHLIVVTRDQPDLPLARLRARGQLAELGAAELRFSPAEADVFLREVMALRLGPAEVDALEARTEGWIAGLHLAALSLRDASDPAAQVAAFRGSHQYVFDYLMEEVIARQPPAVQAFLLETGSLSRFSAPLCDAVREADDSAALLAQVEAANLFLIPLDAERRWYRYHHLFADQLRARLRATQPARAAEVLRRASVWFAGSGLLVEAIEHALQSGDGAFAAGQLEPYSMTVLGWGETEQVGRWFAQLPADVWARRPRLCLNRAWQLFLSNRHDTLPYWLQLAEAALSDQPAEIADALRGEALTLRAFLASDDPEQSLELAQQAAVLAPPDNALVRGLIHMAQAVSYRELGELEPAIAAFEAAIPWHWMAGNFVAALMATADVVLLARVVGQLGRAEAICRQWLARAVESGLERLPAAGLVHQPLAALLIERGQYEAAADHLQQAERVRAAGPADGFLGLAVARLAAVAGDDATVTTRLGPFLERAASPAGLPLTLVTWVVLVLLDAGRFDDVGALLAATSPAGGDPLRALEYQALAARHRAQTALVQGSAPALRTAMGQLTVCLDRAARRRWRGLEIALLATRAVCAFGLRDRDQARADLRQALAWAEADGWVQVFRGLGPPMAALLAHGEKEGWADGPLARAVRAAFGADGGAAGPAPDLPEALSAREIEVLQLMTEGLTYAHIARRLHLSLNTVRYHVKGLYGKLAVSSRADAIARGRALGIV